jgi:peptidoglycan LD-endopeptidase LytH
MPTWKTSAHEDLKPPVAAGPSIAIAARAMVFRHVRRTLRALLLAALSGCSVEHAGRTDSASGSVSGDSALPTRAASVPQDPATDTLVGLEPSVRPESTGRAADGASHGRAGGNAIEATPAELAELSASLIVPVQGVRPQELRDTYPERRDGGTRPHEALDILAPRGSPVLSATDGVLRKLHSSTAGGLMIYAGDASDRFVLIYGHLDRYADGLVEGAPLRRGQVIGYVGTTGNAPALTPHLHFAIARGRPSVEWWRGTPVNPYPLLTRAP